MGSQTIERVGVLGAGIMGTGIACHLANAGLEVILLDIPPPKGGDDRNAFARGALKKARKHKPSPIFHKGLFDRIEIGNLEDDLEKLANCQWVVEAVIENPKIKQDLFGRLEEVLGEDTIITSNTSGIPLATLVEGRSDSFKKRFMITHFFNPVRYMRLLELVAGPDTDPEIGKRLEKFAGDVLGKGVVWCKDTPNFIANRIGTYAMLRCLKEMEAQESFPEEIDAIFSKALGRPKSAVFRTADLVGLDLLCMVAEHCHEGLPDDAERDIYIPPAWLKKLVADGRLGRKSGEGIYRKVKKSEDNPKGLETWDRKAEEYKPLAKVRIDSLGQARNVDDLGDRIKLVTFADDRAGKIAWPVLRDTLAYAAKLVGEISDDTASIDDAMKWGFGWDVGPFETWDLLGFQDTAKKMAEDGIEHAAWVKKLIDDGATSIYGPTGTAGLVADKDPRRSSLATRKARGANVVKTNDGASLVDVGDGVFALEFHSKMNAIDADIVRMLHEGIEYVEEQGAGIVIYNEGEQFSVGANLMLIFMFIQGQQWDQVEEASKQLQDALQKVRNAKVPVVAAPHAMALGGGCEVVLAAASAAGVRPVGELYAGLVEVGVGLIPGAGGTVNTLFGLLDQLPRNADIDITQTVGKVFQQIAMAKVSTNVEEARDLGIIPRHATVSMDRSRQLEDAKNMVLGLHNAGYRPPLPRKFRLSGESGIATLNLMVRSMVQSGYATEHDALIAGKLAHVLCGGKAGHTHEVTEQEVLDLEREAFVSLCGEEKSQARISHMLMKNKPLRN